jgi:hypothetical protein
MKKCLLAILSLMLMLGSGCSLPSFFGESTDSTQNSSVEVEKEDLPLYQMEDVVKPNLLWDTQTLFDVKVERQEADVNLGSNIQAFKFKSAPYPILAA